MPGDFLKAGPQRVVLDNQDYPDGVIRVRRSGDTNDRLQIHESGLIKTGAGSAAPAARSNFARRILTSGSVTINGTSWATFAGAVSIALPAVTGDVIIATVDSSWGSEAVLGMLDIAVMNDASVVRVLSTGIAENAGGFGLSSAISSATAGVSTPFCSTSGLVVASTDIVSGLVTLDLRVRTFTAANKGLSATTTAPLSFQAYIL